MEAYYRKLLDKALVAGRSGEPISFIGMYDSGKTYLFRSLLRLVGDKKEQKRAFIFIDLTGVDPDKEQVLEVLALGILGVSQTEKKPADFQAIYRHVKSIAAKQGVTLVVNLGHEENLSKDLFFLLIQLRNSLGWNFSYLLFGGVGFLARGMIKETPFEKVFKKNLVPVLPLSIKDSQVVVRDYEDRYQKTLPSEVKDKIIALSGGNPGLIKSLFLQAVETKVWNEPDLEDENLRFRLQQILNELGQEEIDVLKAISLKKKKGLRNQQTISFLNKFGYLTKAGTVFSPLLADFVSRFKPAEKLEPSSEDETINVLLSRSERLIFKHLREHRGEIVYRDSLAKILWGESWADKYSDWAIDQLVYALRRKLKTAGNLGRIETKKREGFIYLVKDYS